MSIHLPTTKFLLVRHAQTIWNREHRYAGDSEVPLANEAIDQIAKVSRFLADVQIDAIYCSPLSRCIATITPTAEHHQLRIIIRDELKERNLGEWEGKTADEVSVSHPDHQFPISAYNGDFHVPQAETLEHLEQRLRQCLQEIRESHPGQTVILATHAGVIWAIERHIIENAKSVPLFAPNCSITTLLSDQHHFRLQAFTPLEGM